MPPIAPKAKLTASVRRNGKPAGPASGWIAHVQAYRSAHGCSLKEAMQGASKTWKRPSGAKEQHKPRSYPSYRGVTLVNRDNDSNLREITTFWPLSDRKIRSEPMDILLGIIQAKYAESELIPEDFRLGAFPKSVSVARYDNKNYYLKLRFERDSVYVHVYHTSGIFAKNKHTFAAAAKLWDNHHHD